MKINEFFEKGYYINLDRRVDRKIQFEKEMEKVGLGNFFERFSAHDANENTSEKYKHHYCGSSYVRLFKKIIEEGFERVIVFEDDAIFYDGGMDTGINIVENSLDEINNFPDWELLYFGCFPGGTMKLVSKNLAIPDQILANHAVGYTKSGIKKILEYKPFQDSAIDGWIASRPNIKKYITSELAVAQSDGISDLDASGKSVGTQSMLQFYKNVKRIKSYNGII